MPNNKAKDATHARVACAIREMKKDKHRARTMVGANNMKHKRDVSTPAAHLESEKLLLNSALSRKHSKFMTIGVANFYLMMPMERH